MYSCMCGGGGLACWVVIAFCHSCAATNMRRLNATHPFPASSVFSTHRKRQARHQPGARIAVQDAPVQCASWNGPPVSQHLCGQLRGLCFGWGGVEFAEWAYATYSSHTSAAGLPGAAFPDPHTSTSISWRRSSTGRFAARNIWRTSPTEPDTPRPMMPYIDSGRCVFTRVDHARCTVREAWLR